MDVEEIVDVVDVEEIVDVVDVEEIVYRLALAIIPVRITDTPEGVIRTVNARDLHASLGVNTELWHWVKRQIERARLVEGRDYLAVKKDVQVPHQGGWRTRTVVEYYLTLDAAKHIAMMSGTDKGFELREYFIRVEKEARAPRSFMPAFFKRYNENSASASTAPTSASASTAPTSASASTREVRGQPRQVSRGRAAPRGGAQGLKGVRTGQRGALDGLWCGRRGDAPRRRRRGQRQPQDTAPVRPEITAKVKAQLSASG